MAQGVTHRWLWAWLEGKGSALQIRCVPARGWQLAALQCHMLKRWAVYKTAEHKPVTASLQPVGQQLATSALEKQNGFVFSSPSGLLTLANVSSCSGCTQLDQSDFHVAGGLFLWNCFAFFFQDCFDKLLPSGFSVSHIRLRFSKHFQKNLK